MNKIAYGESIRIAAISFVAIVCLAFTASHSRAEGSSESPFLLGDGYYPDVCIGPAGQVHTVWISGSSLLYRHFDGSLWDVQEPIPMSGAGIHSTSAPDIWVDINNVPHVIWGDDGGPFYYSNKEGGSWSTPELIVDNPDTSAYYFRDVRIAVASDMIRHVIWRRVLLSTGKGEIFHMLFDGGWGTPIKISEGSNPAKRCHLTMGDDDVLHVVWRQGGGSYPDTYQVMYRKWVSGSFEPIILATDTPLRAGEDPHVAVDPLNNPHISFPEGIDVGYVEWLGDSFSDVEIIGTGDDPVIAIDANGTKYVFWEDEYSIDNGSGWSTPEVYDTGALTPDVMGGENEAHVVYTNGASVYYLSMAGGEPASLTLSSPNGGEILLAGSESPITWQWTGFVDSVQLQYSSDDGLNWETIEASYPNSGTYSWTVPSETSLLSRVMISDVDNSQVSDESDGTFTITNDITAPAINDLYLTSASGLVVSFTEPVEESSAEDVSNYVIDNGITVVYAVLDENLTDVHLATTHHVPGITYTITIDGVRDRAVPPNTVAPGTTGEYEYNPSGIGDEGNEPQALPKTYSLSQNFPNPFNPSTRITFTIPDQEVEGSGEVATRLTIYNLKGQLIKTLYEGNMAPGYHTMSWNGRDDYGKSVGSGTYLYHLKAGDFNLTKKMTLVK